MKCFKVLIICLTLSSCSFDNKTGIWKNEKNDTNNESNILKTDVVEIDIKTKDTKFYMYDKDNKVSLIKNN